MGQAVFLDAAISANRRRGKRIVLIGNERIYRLRESNSGRGLLFFYKPSTDRLGFRLTQFLCRLCDGNTFCAQFYIPRAGLKLTGRGDADLALFLPLFQHLFSAEHAVYGYVGDLPLTGSAFHLTFLSGYATIKG